MSKILLKKDGEIFKAALQLEFNIGKVVKKSNEDMVIETSANVKTMKQVFKERLESEALDDNLYDEEKRKDFLELLDNYVDYATYEMLGLKSIPLRAVMDEDGNVKEVEGLDPEREFEIVIEED